MPSVWYAFLSVGKDTRNVRNVGEDLKTMEHYMFEDQLIILIFAIKIAMETLFFHSLLY